VLPPRTQEALTRTRATGAHVVVVTGRMFRAVRPYLAQAQLDDLVVCYQGAVVADPTTGEFLLHVPIPLAEARDAMDAVIAGGFHLNCYLDDLLYVAEVTPEARGYADFQHLENGPVGSEQLVEELGGALARKRRSHLLRRGTGCLQVDHGSESK